MGNPVQTISEERHVTILYSKGSITRTYPGKAESVIDISTDTAMIAGDADQLYMLKTDSRIFMYLGQYMHWEMIDKGANTIKIWMQAGKLYCAKSSGQIWVCMNPRTREWFTVDPNSIKDRATKFDILYKKD
jgi:hypothetical protein